MGALGGRDDASGWLGIQEWESRVGGEEEPGHTRPGKFLELQTAETNGSYSGGTQ